MKSIKALRNSIILLAISLSLVGCTSFGAKDRVWPSPNKPVVKAVEFVPLKTQYGDGVFVSATHTMNLATNISEQKRYIADLESLIKSMKEYYKAK